MAVGPMIGVHRKLPFDFGEAFLARFKNQCALASSSTSATATSSCGA